jgi:acyl carrier protein
MPTYDETLQITTAIFKSHLDDDDHRVIQPKDNIQSDLGLDSLGVMEVVAEIEDKFEITIPNETLTSFSTVEDVARALVKLKG